MAESSPVAKYHRIEVELAARIRAGRYADRSLPSERALAIEFGVARVTIRHALRRLDDQGLVVREARRGTAPLAANDQRRPRLLREHVDRFLDRGRPDQRKVLRFGRVPASEAVAERLAVAGGAPVLRVVRVRSRAGSPLTYTESFVPERLAHVLDRVTLARRPLIQALEDGGVQIGAADQTVRADRCPDAVAIALRLDPLAPVLVLERIVYDRAAMPVQLLLGWYRADRFEIQMRMSRADDLTQVWIRERGTATDAPVGARGQVRGVG